MSEPLAEIIADAQADALMQMKIAKTVRGEAMTKADVRVVCYNILCAMLPAPRNAQGATTVHRNVIPPPPEAVTAYSASIGYAMDGQKWCDQYAAKGWMVGKAKMKDWQAAVRNWKASRWGEGTITIQAKAPSANASNYTKL
jgi:hypothetical protein